MYNSVHLTGVLALWVGEEGILTCVRIGELTGECMAKRARLVIYIPEDFLEALKSAYPECSTDSEVIVKHLMEVHATWMEHRSFPEKLSVIAKSYLVTKYGDEYSQYLKNW